MYTFLSRKGQLIAIILGVALTAIFLISVFASSSNFANLDAKELIKSDYSNVFNFGLMAAIGLVVLCAIAAIVLGLINMLGDIKGSMKAIIGVAVLVVLFLIAYAMASPDATGSLQETIREFGVLENQSKLISGGIITTGILLLISFVSLILFELYNLVK